MFRNLDLAELTHATLALVAIAYCAIIAIGMIG